MIASPLVSEHCVCEFHFRGLGWRPRADAFALGERVFLAVEAGASSDAASTRNPRAIRASVVNVGLVRWFSTS